MPESIVTDTISISSDSDANSVHSVATSNGSRQRNEKPRRGKRRAAEALESEENDLMVQALAVMSQKNDEFDIFGQYVASELRQIPDPSIRQVVKREIIQALLNSEISVVSSAGRINETIVQTQTQHTDCYEIDGGYEEYEFLV